MGMRRDPLLLYFLSTEMLFTRKISSWHLILLAVDCGCTYSTMHLLNCLLLKLYKQCRRSHCHCMPSPSGPLYNERQGKRAHKKFRGHCFDGMLDGTSVAPPSDPPELHGSLWNRASGPKTKREGYKRYAVSISAVNLLIYFPRKRHGGISDINTCDYKGIYLKNAHFPGMNISKLFNKFFGSVTFLVFCSFFRVSVSLGCHCQGYLNRSFLNSILIWKIKKQGQLKSLHAHIVMLYQLHNKIEINKIYRALNGRAGELSKNSISKGSEICPG